MKQVQLHLIPTPGAKPEFVSTLQEQVAGAGVLDKLPSKVVLEGYTRDAWAWKPNPKAWTETVVKSVDGRNKIPGFVGYLKERRKAAYGRFSPTSLLVVSYIQKKHENPNTMTVRICLDLTQLDNCPLNKGKAPAPQKPPPQDAPQSKPPKAAATTTKKRKAGVLGNLLGAQIRTNQHMAHSAKKKKSATTTTAATATAAGAAGGAAPAAVVVKTAQEVLASFRQELEQEMLDFDLASDVVYRKKINLADTTRVLSDDDKGRVTMDVLKYIVYEQAEEVNEEWVAHKEPSEFMDECTIAIYKEGQAPPEVLEEMNRVELPEDVRGQQKALQDARQRKVASQEAKRDKEVFSKAIHDSQNDDFEALNTDKRDRRTIEEIQRDANKRIRT